MTTRTKSISLLLNFTEARKLAMGTIGQDTLSGMKTSRRGAYFFHSYSGGPLYVVDERILEPSWLHMLTPHGTPRDCRIFFDRQTGRRLSFATGLDLKVGYIRPPRSVSLDFRVWLLKGDAWALGFIGSGGRPGNFTDREALDPFDRKYAGSAHARLRARQLLAGYEDAC